MPGPEGLPQIFYHQDIGLGAYFYGVMICIHFVFSLLSVVHNVLVVGCNRRNIRALEAKFGFAAGAKAQIQSWQRKQADNRRSDQSTKNDDSHREYDLL